MPRGEPWTADEDAILAAAYAEGRTDREIAALLRDRGENAVRRRRQVLALTTEARIINRERLRELHAQGLDADALAAALGTTYRVVQELCSRERLPLGDRRARWGTRTGRR
jgi:hypothetical protein